MTFFRRLYVGLWGRKKVSKEQGKVLWGQLNAKLPPAVGVICDDEPRMVAFVREVKTMSKTEKASLKLYLEDYLDFYDDTGDLVSGYTEMYCARQRQICRTHLQYL